MLDPREVRVGNWVLKVTGKDARDKAYLEYRPVAIDEYYFTWAKYCFPIRLTPDILRLCAFELHAGCWRLPVVQQNGEGSPLLEWSPAGGWYLYGHKMDVQLLYVHQLQNLFYALSGQELRAALLPYQNIYLIQPVRFHGALRVVEEKKQLL